MTVTKNDPTAPIRRVDFSKPFAKTSLPTTTLQQVQQGAQDRAQQQPPPNKLHELRPVDVRGSYIPKDGGR